MSRAIGQKILALAATLTLAALAQAETAKNDSASAESIQRLFQAGFYDVAQARAEVFLKSNPPADAARDVKLLEAQCYYYMGRYEAALNLLKPLSTVAGEKTAMALYWQAETLVAIQQWAGAEEAYRQVIASPQGEKFRDDSRLGLSWSLYKQGKQKEAQQLLSGLMEKEPSSLTTQKAKLLSAKIGVADGNMDAAQKTLGDLINSAPKPSVLFEAAYFLGEVNTTKKDFAHAAEAYKRVTENSQATPKSLVAYSFYGLGNALMELKQPQEAQTAFYQAFVIADKEQLKLTALDRYFEAAHKGNNVADTGRRVREWAGKNGDRPFLPPLLLRTSAFLRENDKEELALALIKDYSTVLEQASYKSETQLELGRCYRAANQPQEAQKILMEGIAAPNPALVGDFEYELGATDFELKNYTEATQFFTKLGMRKDKLEEHAQVGLLFTLAAQKKLPEFVKNEENFRQNFPQSKFSDRIQLLHGWLLESLGKPNEAKAIYEKALASVQDKNIKAQFLFQLGSLLYRSGDLTKAEPLYEQFINEYPSHPLAPEAATQLTLALVKENKIAEDKVPAKLLEMWEKNKTGPSGPRLLFEVAEHYYNKQDYTNAHIYFAELLKEYPESHLAAEGAYWGGLAAANHNDYAAALSLLEKIPDGDSRKLNARVMQGKLYQKQLLFENALTIYDSVLSAVKSGPLYAEIQLLRGNCLFALGEKNKQNFDLALNCYIQVYNNKDALPEIKNEAAFRRGKTLEKLGRSGDALAAYLDVLLEEAPVDTQRPPREIVWRNKAGLEAARMKEEAKDWQGAIEIYKRLEKLGGPDQLHYREVINRIRRNNYFYE